MKILIPEPNRFYCEADEDHFFSWLEEIPATKEVKGKPEGLQVTFITPIGREDFYELVGLLTKDQNQVSGLKALCEAQNDRRFNDPKNYWYSAVFA